MLLFDLVKEKLVLWKQMRCLEVTAAIVAKTLMEMGVQILLSPEEITWPTGDVTKPACLAPKKKGGKKVAKNKHGVFGELVNDLAPKLPADNAESIQKNKESVLTDKKQSTQKLKGSQSAVNASQIMSTDNNEAHHDEFQTTTHTGLAVQARKCTYTKQFKWTQIIKIITKSLLAA